MFVSDDHKKELELVPAHHMVLAHVWNALPTDGSSVKRSDLVKRLNLEIGGIYELCRGSDRQKNGIGGAVGSIQTTLNRNLGYIQCGGTGTPRGYWRWNYNGRELCRHYIIKNSRGFDPDSLIELAADVRLNDELKREDDLAFKLFQEQQLKAPAVPETEGVTEPVEEVETSLLKRAIYWVERKLIGCGVLKAETE